MWLLPVDGRWNVVAAYEHKAVELIHISLHNFFLGNSGQDHRGATGLGDCLYISEIYPGSAAFVVCAINTGNPDERPGRYTGALATTTNRQSRQNQQQKNFLRYLLIYSHHVLLLQKACLFQ
jgi:hypothetical protein